MLNFIIKKSHSFLFYRTPYFEIYTKLFDLLHHLKYSFKGTNLKKDKVHLQYYLTKQYHIIEKGLSLPEPRLGFGQPKIIDIIKKTNMYEKLFCTDQLVFSIRKTILEYMNFNIKGGFEFSDNFNLIVNNFLNQGNYSSHGGVKQIKKISSTSLNLEEFRNFSQSRVSVRDFSNESISDSIIYEIVETAKNAPSVCNRQGWKTHYYNEKNKIKKILSYQNGNTGFTEKIDKLIIVTSDSKAFTKYESNQVFIDGGLFSMNLLLAIHAAGLGACALNTCYTYFMEKKVKKISGIPDNERLIMMIALGCLKENYNVAYSKRKEADKILITHFN